MQITLCRCGLHPAVPAWLVCALCADRQQHADEAAHRAAAVASYDAGVARMEQIGSAGFVPETDAERRLHRAARRGINYGNGRF